MQEVLKRFGESLGERQSDSLIGKVWYECDRRVVERLDWRSAQRLVRGWLFRFDV